MGSAESSMPGAGEAAAMARQIAHFASIRAIKTDPNERINTITLERLGPPGFFSKIKGLQPDQITQLRPEQIKTLPPPLIGSLTKEQQEAFTLLHAPHFTVNQLLQLKYINPIIAAKIDLKLILQLPEEYKRAYLKQISTEGIADIKKSAELCKSISKGDKPEICRQMTQIARSLSSQGQVLPMVQQSLPYYSQPQRPMLAPIRDNNNNGIDGGMRRKKQKSKKVKRRPSKKTRRHR